VFISHSAASTESDTSHSEIMPVKTGSGSSSEEIEVILAEATSKLSRSLCDLECFADAHLVQSRVASIGLDLARVVDEHAVSTQRRHNTSFGNQESHSSECIPKIQTEYGFIKIRGYPWMVESHLK
jgi:hypothetical protein